MKKTALPPRNAGNMTGDVNIKKEVAVAFRLDGERSRSHSRHKRFLSYPRYVEVMVTADAKMLHHHGQNLQHYVLTLMSIVSTGTGLFLNVHFIVCYFRCVHVCTLYVCGYPHRPEEGDPLQ